MEPLAIAAATLAAKWAAESFVKEAAKSGLASLKPIYDWVRSKFLGDPSGEAVLQKVNIEPNNESHTSTLAELINDRLESDPSLKPELDKLLAAAKDTPETHSFVVQVLGNAKVGKITNIGTVMGSVSF